MESGSNPGPFDHWYRDVVVRYARFRALWGTFLFVFGALALYGAFLRHSLLYWPLSPAGALILALAFAGGILVHDGLHAIGGAWRAYAW